MRIWKLSWVNEGAADYDQVHAFAIRAPSEDEARNMAASEASGEGAGFWKNPALSKCEIVEADGNPEIIVRHFHAG